MRLTNGFWGFVFLTSAALQFNDPDPLIWVFVYSAAAAMCVAWERQWLSERIPIVVTLVSAASAAGILAGAPVDIDISTALTDWGMSASGSEEIREVGGLILVALWSGFLSFHGPRPASPAN
jgi:hypothetical protein